MMKMRMTRRLLLGLALLTAATAESASVQQVEACWTTNFADTLRVWAEIVRGPSVLYVDFKGQWDGPGAYRLRAIGTAAESYPVEGQIILTLLLDNGAPAPFFDGNPDCKLRVPLDPSTLNGTGRFHCTGGPGITFTNSHVQLTFDPSCFAEQPRARANAFRSSDVLGLAPE